MPIRPGASLLAAVVLRPAAVAATDLEFSMEDAIEVMRAAGAVMATEAGLEHAARHCAEHYPDLARTGRQRLDDWARRNEPTLVRSRQLSDMVLAAVTQRSGVELAARMRARLHEDTAHQARELVATVETRLAEDQHYLCERLLDAIEHGLWDFPYSHPEVHQTLLRDYAPD